MPRASANRPGRSHKNPDDDGRKAEGEAPVVTVTTSNYLMLAERYLISSREQLVSNVEHLAAKETDVSRRRRRRPKAETRENFKARFIQWGLFLWAFLVLSKLIDQEGKH